MGTGKDGKWMTKRQSVFQRSGFPTCVLDCKSTMPYGSLSASLTSTRTSSSLIASSHSALRSPSSSFTFFRMICHSLFSTAVSWSLSTLCRKPRSLLLWNRVTTQRPCSVAASASWWESSPVNKRSAFTFRRTWAPLPAQIATDRICMSSTWRPWGMATGKPLGLPTPRAIRSMMTVKGWGLLNLTIRPIPAPSKPTTVIVRSAVFPRIGDLWKDDTNPEHLQSERSRSLNGWRGDWNDVNVCLKCKSDT